MNKRIFHLIIIGIILIIIIGVYFFIYNCGKKEGLNAKKSLHVDRVGNLTCEYFTDMGTAFYEGKDFVDTCFDDVYHSKKNPLYNLIAHLVPLDLKLQQQLKTISSQSIEEIKHRRSVGASWIIKTDDHYDFWMIMKPTIRNTYLEIFEKLNLSEAEMNIQYPVIHYRCSDVPFSKHQHYHIQRFQYYKDSLEELKQKGINTNKVIILYSASHLSENDNAKSCDNYIQMLRDYLSNMGIASEIRSNSNMEDFATMFYAPATISTGGSFSFMSAFFGKGSFITAPSEPIQDCKKCGFIKPQYNIEHDDVSSYYDMDEMKSHFLESR